MYLDFKMRKWEELSSFQQYIIQLLFSRQVENVELARMTFLGQLREIHGQNYLPVIGTKERHYNEGSIQADLEIAQFEEMHKQEKTFLRACGIPFYMNFYKGFNYFLHRGYGFLNGESPYAMVVVRDDYPIIKKQIECIKSYPALRHTFLYFSFPEFANIPNGIYGFARNGGALKEYPDIPIEIEYKKELKHFIEVFSGMGSFRPITVHNTNTLYDDLVKLGLSEEDSLFKNVKNLCIYHRKPDIWFKDRFPSAYDCMKVLLDSLAQSELWKANNITVKHI
jgi:hypothetical protein